MPPRRILTSLLRDHPWPWRSEKTLSSRERSGKGAPPFAQTCFFGSVYLVGYHPLPFFEERQGISFTIDKGLARSD